MKNLLVTGASGFLGYHICRNALHNWNVYGTRFSSGIILPNAEIRMVDLCDFNAVNRILKEIKPDAVIHTAAQSNAGKCELYPTESKKINVGVSVFLAMYCSKKNIPFIFTSTDLVFNGTKAPYNEIDRASPIHNYGKQKVEVEDWLRTHFAESAICRLPLMFGDSPGSGKGLIREYLHAFKAGEVLNLFSDEYRTLANVNRVSEGILNILEKKGSGVFHLSGNERISRIDFGTMVAEAAHASAHNLVPVLQSEFRLSAPRPPDVSMTNQRAVEFGFRPGIMKEEIKRIVDEILSE